MKLNIMNRRKFLTSSTTMSLPFISGFPLISNLFDKTNSRNQYTTNFILEGHFFSTKQYINILNEIESKRKIKGDFYSQGGVVEELEQKFQKVTGKESAIYMPSGTMANELSIRFLCGNRTKAIVHGESHIYRDEGDSAQAIHNKRLVTINNDSHYFTLKDLKKEIAELSKNESFQNGIGALSIENPVRRHLGKIFEYDEMKAITDYAKKNNINTHLDGARLHIASLYSGISVKAYCELFNTVYISLYKYLGAAGGAMLCGDKATIEPMRHYIKILGGTVFRSWVNAAVANYFIDGLEDRLKEMKNQSEALLTVLNNIDEITIEKPVDGTNIVLLKSNSINLEKFAREVNERHGIIMNYPRDGMIQIHFNESILQKTNAIIISNIKDAIVRSK